MTMKNRKKQEPTRYAEGTTVPVEKSHIEVQKILKRYGATNSGFAEKGEAAAILFTMKGRRYRIELIYPAVGAFQQTGKVRRTQAQAAEAREKEIRRLWRALFMVVKAKLEAAQSGIVTFEQEFLAHTVLANDQTMSEWMEGQLRAGKVPLLPETAGARPEEVPDIVIEGEFDEV